MTYHSDPTRWTQSQGPDGAADDGASELLRSAFRSGSREGPNNLQMHTLALKLAAVGTGAALSAGAATAHASATAAGASAATVGGAVGALKTGGALSLSKLALSIVLVGATATGTVVLQRSGALSPNHAPAQHAAQQVSDTHRATLDTIVQAPTTQPLVNVQAQPTQLDTPATVAPERLPSTEVQAAAVPPAQLAVGGTPSMEAASPASVHAESASSAEHRANRAARHKAARASNSAHAAVVHASARAPEDAVRAAEAPQPRAAAATSPTATNLSVRNVPGQRQQPTEIELLGKARSALAAHPRDAYRLVQQHKELYPQGVFAQERDALAVEAAQRAGELKLAQQLAESFVQRYPSSPHAHRFRETMNLQ